MNSNFDACAVLLRSWLLDVLICNWLGIWAGMRTVKRFGCAPSAWLNQAAVQCCAWLRHT